MNLETFLTPEFRKPIRLLRESGFVSQRQIAIAGTLNTIVVFFEGLGVASVVPILEYVEKDGDFVALENGSPLWRPLISTFSAIDLPVTMATLTLITFALILCRQTLNYILLVKVQRIQQSFQKQMMEDYFIHAMASRPEYLSTIGTGHFINIAYQQCQITSKLIQELFALWRMFLTFCAYVTIMLVTSLPATVMAFAVLVAVLITVNRLVKMAQDISERQVVALKTYTHFLGDRFHAWKLIKLNNALGEETQVLRSMTGRIYGLYINLTKAVGKAELIAVPLVAAFTLTALYAATQWFHLSLTIITIFVVILMRLSPVAQGFTRTRQRVANVTPSFDMVMTAIRGARNLKEVDLGERICPDLKNRIEYKNVAFTYPAAEGAALRDVSVEIPAGCITAIAGPSGAGKSTFVEMLPRLALPKEGEILWDGVALSSFSLTSLRDQIAYVPQDPEVLNLSVIDNVRYARPGASEGDVHAACEAAFASHFVEGLPQGYHTILGETGHGLSGGQRQRLVLARALIKNASLIILDESTSALDSESESHIHLAMENLITAGKTIIVIAHRPSTIQTAKHIIVLENGRIIESGSPHDLHKDDS